jgi:predicted nucleic acid-binding protein
VYDCFYLALSEAEDAPLVTADRRLVAKVAGTPFAARTLHLSAATARG